MDIVVTGFGYYGGYWNNPSGEIARLLDGVLINNFRVRGFVLPVSFNKARVILREILESFKPKLVLGLGLNPSTRMVDLELASVNKAFFTQPDVDGFTAKYIDVEGGGPSILYTTLPVEKILVECREKRLLPLRPSLSTGLFLCNTIAYIIMKYGVERNVPAGFLHIPPSTINQLRRETGFGLPLQDILDTVRCVLEVSTSGLN